MINNSNNEVYISFEEVIIENMTFNINNDRIIDSLYRGRTEINGELVDVLENNFSYFYLEFYEGNKIEFWAKYLSIYE